MKKKYIISLSIIGIMLAITLTMGTGYGLWISTNNQDELSSNTIGCFKIYYQDSKKNIIEMKNINPVTTEEGLEKTSPYTLTIENVCDVNKELQVRLNVLNDTTVDLKSLTLESSGYIVKDASLYNNLELTKSENANVVQSRLIGVADVKPHETVRTNIKLWFDERRNPKIEKDKIFKGQFELIDAESSIKAKFYEKLLTEKTKIEAKAAPNFTNVSTSSDGLYAAETSNGKSYYYRGVVTNNYVQFGNFIWRIVRINDDGTIKLILDKSAGTPTMYNKLLSPEKDYVGYKYIWYSQETNSTAKDALDAWYKTNVTDQGLDKYVTTTSFCNDTGYENASHIYFNGYKRLVTDHAPSLVCPAGASDFGGTYNTKVGLITADEVVMAGGTVNTNNMNYYLYNGENFVTFTPYDFNLGKPTMFSVNNTGALVSTTVNTELGLRPVITLISDITVSGSGTENSPYTIDME